jgi:hypothetical protein
VQTLLQSNHQTQEVVFIDADVAAVDALVHAVRPGLEIVQLDAQRDALDQITAELARHQGLLAVHFIAHGESGALRLHGLRLDQRALAARSVQLEAWNTALAPGADVLVYGCSVGVGAEGAAWVTRLAETLRADVAASSVPVGAAHWQLDVRRGSIDVPVALSPSAAAYPLTLDAILTNIKGIDASSNVRVFDTAADASGNLYYTGSFAGSADFGAGTVVSPNPDPAGATASSRGSAVFVAKYNVSGALQWVKTLSSAKTSVTYGDRGRQLKVDASGNVYVAGTFMADGPTATSDGTSTMNFNPGGTAVTRTGQQGNNSGFLIKYNSSGTFQWVWTLYGYTGVSPFVDLNADGSAVHIFGSYNGSAGAANSPPAASATDGLGTTRNLTSNENNTHYFSTKLLATTGAETWMAIGSGAGNHASQLAYGIAVDASGNAYCVGSMNKITFSPSVILDTGISTNAGFIWKLDASGATTWAKKMDNNPATSATAIRGIDFDTSNNVYITGTYQGTPDLDLGAGATAAPASAGGNDMFVVKLDTNGNRQWSFTGGGVASDSGERIVLDGSSVYVQGTFGNNTSTTATFGSTTLTTVGFIDNFVLKLAAADGAFTWAESFGSERSDSVAGIALLTGGNIKVCGSILYTADMDPGAGVLNATNSTLVATDNLAALASVSWTSAGALVSATPLPTVTSISPTSGTTAGGTSVTITGTDLTGATGVTIGGGVATSLSANTATSLTCVTPAGTAGVTSVLVTTAGGTNAANTLFTYVAPVAISSLTRVTSTPTKATSVSWTLTFASAVTGLTSSNLALTGAAATGSTVGTPTTSNSGLTWTVPVTTGTTDGALTLRVANATGLSAGISTTLPFDGDTITMDKTPPSVVSVVRLTPTGQTTNLTSVTFRVTYSEAVTLPAPTVNRFTLVAINGGTTTGTVASVTGSGNTRDVTVNVTGGSGEFRLRAVD